MGKEMEKEKNKYDDYGRLKFEGEYLNGQRNGKGKEYDGYCRLIFEGEYLNGQRNGKGKEYDYKGELMFEGEYLNGKRWNGKGKKSNTNIIEKENKLKISFDSFSNVILKEKENKPKDVSKIDQKGDFFEDDNSFNYDNNELNDYYDNFYQ